MADQEEQNLDFAKTLWEKLLEIDMSMRERLMHLYRILTLAELLRKAPVIRTDQNKRVADVLCSGTTDVATVIGANSRLRSDCVKCTAAKYDSAKSDSRQNFSKNSTQLEKKLGFKVGAFDHDTSRLFQEMVKELEGVSPEAPIKRPFQACAEHAVFEKLDRIGGQRPCFTYAVQKKGESEEQSTFQVKIVERCRNCQVAGGPAQDDGQPFGITARLGRVVTDHPSLINLDVPVITPRVLQYLRTVIGAYNSYDTETSSDDAPFDVVGFAIPQVRVWSNVSMQQHAIVPSLGPTDAANINQELSAAGLLENLLDDGGPPPNPYPHDEL